MKINKLISPFIPYRILLKAHRLLERFQMRKLHHALSRERHLLTEAKAQFVAWNLDQALSLAEQAVSTNPSSQKGLRLRARILLSQGRIEEAKAAATALLEQYPICRVGLRLLGAIGEPLPAASKDRALSFVRTHGGHAKLYVEAAQYLYDAELFEDALEVTVLGMTRLPDVRDQTIRSNIQFDLLKIRADCLELLHDFEEARQLFEQIMVDHRKKQAGVAGIARCAFELGDLERAEQVIRDSYGDDIKLWPWAPLSLEILQARGKIKEAYQFYRTKPVSIGIAEHFGMPSPSKIDLSAKEFAEKSALLLSEGGPGDELRLCSAYPDLAGRFKDLTITTDPRLAPIMERTFPDIKFLPVSRYRTEIASQSIADRSQVGDARIIQCVSNDVSEYGKGRDFVASVLDTLADVRPTRLSFPTVRPTLAPKAELAEAWRAAIGEASGGKMKVGVTWRSILQSTHRNRHYFQLEQMLPFFRIEEAEFVIIQPRLSADEMELITKLDNVYIPKDLDLVDDFEGQLALISVLDLVIAPFTTMGELAGAAGVDAIMMSGARTTMWRAGLDGRDIFSGNVHIVGGDPIFDKESAVASAVEKAKRILAEKVACSQNQRPVAERNMSLVVDATSETDDHM